MSSSSNAVFTGSSTFSNDFAQVVTRAQQIASLPISLLNNQKTSLTAEQTALNGLSTAFASFQASVISLDLAANGSNTAVSYSDPSVAGATAAPGVLPGDYTIEVVDPGSLASATSAAGTVSDPSTSSISDASSYTLHANGQVYDYITLAANTLSSLADAINQATNGAVKATIVNLGTTAAPSYQLSVQNTKYGALPITLDDGQGGPNLLGDETAASSVQYRVNGQPASPASPLTSDTNTITLAPNLSVTALQAGTTTITVSQSTASIANALSSFVNAYNQSVTALDGQRGSSGGALAGQSVLNTLSQSLRDVLNYGGVGSLSLSDLGVSFDKSYDLTFDPAVLTATAAKDFKGVTEFLGSTSTGGFLKAANDTLNSVTDSVDGVIPTMLLSVAGEITDTGNKISANQDLVDQMTDNLNAQMAAADALIATMQQQASYFTNMFAAMTASQNTMK
jgi:flagellar hook-associated protein 2